MVTEGDASFSLELTQWEDPKGTGLASSPAYHRGLYRIALGVDDVKAAYEALGPLTGRSTPPSSSSCQAPGSAA